MDFTEYRKRVLKEYEGIDGVEPPSDEQILLTFISLGVYLKFEREEVRKLRNKSPKRSVKGDEG